MGKFFNLDNPLFQGINKFVDAMFLSLLWLLFSIPLITIGASTSALYYTANKVIRHNRSYVFREFWGSFKSCFKQSTAAWLIFALTTMILQMDIRLMRYIIGEGATQTIGIAFFYAVQVIMIMIAQYVFTYIARFSLPLKEIVRNSLILAFRHLPWTILLVLLEVVSVLLVMLIPLLVFLVPCVWGTTASLILERIYKKYMSEEDLERENKLNGKEYL